MRADKSHPRPAMPRLPLDEEPIRPTFRRERSAIRRGLFPVAGVDEAGRGPLAGPVVAAAVILEPERMPRGLDDSKRLDPAEREKLYDRICAMPRCIAFGSRARIDRTTSAGLVVGAARGAALPRGRASCSSTARPHRQRLRLRGGGSGDALVLSIAAASIIAKVTRDRLMGGSAPPIPVTASSATWDTACPSICRAGAARADRPSPPVLCPGRGASGELTLPGEPNRRRRSRRVAS